jgi:hypothetical protein
VYALPSHPHTASSTPLQFDVDGTIRQPPGVPQPVPSQNSFPRQSLSWTQGKFVPGGTGWQQYEQLGSTHTPYRPQHVIPEGQFASMPHAMRFEPASGGPEPVVPHAPKTVQTVRSPDAHAVCGSGYVAPLQPHT